MNIQKVKPCPFCGGKVKFYMYQASIYSSCENECVIFNEKIEYERHRVFRRLPFHIADVDNFEAAMEKTMLSLAEKWNRRPGEEDNTPLDFGSIEQ